MEIKKVDRDSNFFPERYFIEKKKEKKKRGNEPILTSNVDNSI